MSLYRHVPSPPLNQYVDFFWYYVDFLPDHDREHVLPDGTFELIINLQDTPRKLFHRADADSWDAFKRGWISGAQRTFLVIDALPRSSMIGVHFKPGGATAFLGLRQYLKQRKIDIPPTMAGLWLGLGAAVIVAFLVIGAILPRPASETPLVDISSVTGSQDRQASQYAQGGSEAGITANPNLWSRVPRVPSTQSKSGYSQVLIAGTDSELTS